MAEVINLFDEQQQRGKQLPPESRLLSVTRQAGSLWGLEGPPEPITQYLYENGPFDAPDGYTLYQENAAGEGVTVNSNDPAFGQLIFWTVLQHERSNTDAPRQDTPALSFTHLGWRRLFELAWISLLRSSVEHCVAEPPEDVASASVVLGILAPLLGKLSDDIVAATTRAPTDDAT